MTFNNKIKTIPRHVPISTRTLSNLIDIAQAYVAKQSNVVEEATNYYNEALDRHYEKPSRRARSK